MTQQDESLSGRSRGEGDGSLSRGTPGSNVGPLIFISHDARDAELAEAFSKLLKGVSGGVLKSFRSSDRKGSEGINYGLDWYRELMSQIELASEVVCLLTPRSLNRPWILYEVGVAKGTLDKRAYGLALGIPLGKANTGPFAQFQNCGNDEDSVTKLVVQLMGQVRDAEPDEGVVRDQVKVFLDRVLEHETQLAGSSGKESEGNAESDIFKVFEEIKLMFQQILVDRLEDDSRSRHRRMNPAMLEQLVRMLPEGLLNGSLVLVVAASMVRDDAPWLYELGMEAYRATRGSDHAVARDSVQTFQHVLEATLHGPIMELTGSRMGLEQFMVAERLVRLFPLDGDKHSPRPGNQRRPSVKEERA